MVVIKRDGRKVQFDASKISNAIESALRACYGSNFTDENLIDKIVKTIIKTDKKEISVEEIQESIINLMIKDGRYPEAIKSYIIYKEKHDQKRQRARRNIDFLKNFIQAGTTADATIDDNANVGTKSIGVLNAEIHKEANQDTNFTIWADKIKELYNIPVKQVEKDFNTILYAHDLSSQVLMPYCMSVSMYPFLIEGLKKLGGLSAAPKNLDSFCGIYINLVFALAGQVKGAVATPEALMYFDYFARKEYGEDYYKNSDALVNNFNKRTIGGQIDQYFQQITYSINQIAANRGMQSAFTNFSFFDKYFFEGMFGDFVFPDGTKPVWESLNWLQQRYLHWLNQERLKCILTFPVCSYACLTENGEFKDLETKNFICKEYEEGNSFFVYLSDTVDSLSSCCRLQNAIQDNTFNFTNGQIGIMTGSQQVVTLNLNRIIQNWARDYAEEDFKFLDSNKTMQDTFLNKNYFDNYFKNILERVYKYLKSYNCLLKLAENSNQLYPAYNAGFISLDKQYLTIGINGLNQAAEFLGIKCNKNEVYQQFCTKIFSLLKENNTKHKDKGIQFNTEIVPAESAAIKLYNRDERDGYWVPTDTNLYASYIFKPNDERISVLDKIILHSSAFAADKLDGGSACHINLSGHASEKQYDYLLTFAAATGCKYLTFNIPNCECEDCGFIAKQPFTECPKCSGKNVVLWDRIIGYLTKIRNWSSGRRKEQKLRVYTEYENTSKKEE